MAGKKVIYIENEQLLRDAVVAYLVSNEYEAFSYEGSEDMSYFLEDISPDFVFIDEEAREETFEVLRKLALSFWVTGKKEKNKLPSNKLEGCISYLQKPLSLDQVLDLLIKRESARG